MESGAQGGAGDADAGLRVRAGLDHPGAGGIAAPAGVVGIDIGERQLENARSLAGDRGMADVSFQRASMYDLPFPDASFDAVLAHTAVEHLGDPLAAFREVRRVLKPGGVFGVRDPDYSTIRFTPGSPRPTGRSPRSSGASGGRRAGARTTPRRSVDCCSRPASRGPRPAPWR